MYRVLYRKWRPQVFDDVVGQPQVTETLLSQLRENRTAHAYLFTGSRGTGKTTCAKIFAKALNCLHPAGGDPCNECEICRGIDGGTVLDIVEIDAASNRGIDDIRMLRDEANFTPSQARYRVYIIDEVHMLTIEAFNALLKTLEEPPEHVKFILATTEVHKLPSTILSRCQRFDFRRIEPDIIADRLMYIAEREETSLDRDAALLIARIADGGMRDALSLLDRAISVSEHVTSETVASSAGLMGKDAVFDLVEALAEKDISRCLSLLNDFHNASCDTERLINELLNQFRNYLVIKTVKNPAELIVCTDEELKRIESIAELFTKEQILHTLAVLSAAAEAVKRTQNRRIEAETALIRLCTPEADTDTEALLARISALEREMAEIKAGNGSVKRIPLAEASHIAPKKEPQAQPTDKKTERDTAENAPPLDDAPFGDAPPLDDEPPLDGAPFGDAPPFGDEPPFDGNQAEEKVSDRSDFAGFGAESGSASSFADKFAQTDGGDDEPFDFDAFMSEYAREEDSDGDGDDGKEKAEVLAPPDETVKNKPGIVEERIWVRIILAAEQSFKPLIGQFTNSCAFIRGSTLYIRPANPAIKQFVPESMLTKHFSSAVKDILGKEYKLKYDNE